MKQNKSIFMNQKKLIQGKNLLNSSHFVLDNIFRESSIPIITQIRSSRSRFGKIAWTFVLLTSFIGCIYQTQAFLKVYLKYPLLINLEEKQNTVLNFPGVTICNLNRVKNEYAECMNEDILERGCKLADPVQTPGRVPIIIIIKPVPGGTRISERRVTLSCSNVVNKTVKHVERKTKVKLDFLRKYLAMDEKNRKFVGQQASELIKHCSFDNHPCFSKDFAHFTSLQYGNCYTFNKATNSKVSLKSSSIGYTSGLKLLLNLEVEKYLSLSEATGLRVVIHDPNEEAYPEEEGIDISPGIDTSVALKQVIFQRLPAPYKDQCINYETRINQTTAKECMHVCLQEQSYEKCGCIDPTVKFFSSLRRCDMQNKKDICCMENVQNNIAVEDSLCNCPLPCISITYDMELSKSLWPSKFAKFLNKKSNNTFENYKRNYVSLSVFYSTLTQSIYKQLPMFEDSEIFSHLGGSLGLWLGLTLFALLELVEAILHLCNNMKKCYGSG